MTNTQERSLKDRLRDLIAHGRAIRQEFLSRLSDAQRARPGQIGDWSTTSAKDVIAHVTFWQRLALERAEAERIGGADLPDPDVLKINDENFLATRDLTWDAVLAQAEAIDQAHLAALDRYTDAEVGADRFIRRFVGNNYLHPVQHYVDYWLANDGLTHARTLSEQTLPDMRALDLPDATRDATYNLACFYARTGDADQAIALLAEPLRSSPALHEWAKQDPDLESLRDLPAFKAFYTPA